MLTSRCAVCNVSIEIKIARWKYDLENIVLVIILYT